MPRALLFATLLLTAALSTEADEIFLTNGRVLEGVVLERTADQVVIEMAAGKMTLPVSMIERVEAAPSRLTEFEKRLANLPEDDVEGLLALAFWAEANRLDTRAQSTFEQVLTIDPRQVVAREILGRLGDEEPLAPPNWQPPRHLLKANSADPFDTHWTLPELVPGQERELVGRLLGRVLSLALDCRWAEASWRLADLLEQHADSLDKDRLHPVLFALEVAAHTGSPEIRELFSAEEGSFLRRDCLVFLDYSGTRKPREWQGGLTHGEDALELRAEEPARLQIPFRRPGAVRHLGSNETVVDEALFEGRMAPLAEGGSARIGWHAVLRGEDPWAADTPRSQAHLTAHRTANAAWTLTGALWRNQVARFEHRTDLPGAYFSEPHTVRSVVERESARFGVDREVADKLNLPASDLLYLFLEAQGSAVRFDGLTLSGPIDGSWVARRLATRHK